MTMHEYSHKLYPSTAALHEMTIECSIIMPQIIHSFETNTS